MIDLARFERMAAQLPPRGPGRLVVIGIDGSWRSAGWTIATPAGPLAAGHWAPGTYRERDLVRLLDRLSDQAEQVDVPPGRRFVVVERPPLVYSGRDNQAATAYGIGLFVGAVQAWTLLAAGYHYPWTPSTREWREWWWPGTGRQAKRSLAKRAAFETATASWPGLLDGWSPHTAEKQWEGPGVDVAEAVLLGVGAARIAARGETSAKPSDRSLPPRLPRDWVAG